MIECVGMTRRFELIAILTKIVKQFALTKNLDSSE